MAYRIGLKKWMLVNFAHLQDWLPYRIEDGKDGALRKIITPEQFAEKLQGFTGNLDSLFSQSRELEAEIKKQLAGLKYE